MQQNIYIQNIIWHAKKSIFKNTSRKESIIEPFCQTPDANMFFFVYMVLLEFRFKKKSSKNRGTETGYSVFFLKKTKINLLQISFYLTGYVHHTMFIIYYYTKKNINNIMAHYKLVLYYGIAWPHHTCKPKKKYSNLKTFFFKN